MPRAPSTPPWPAWLGLLLLPALPLSLSGAAPPGAAPAIAAPAAAPAVTPPLAEVEPISLPVARPDRPADGSTGKDGTGQKSDGNSAKVSDNDTKTDKDKDNAKDKDKEKDKDKKPDPSRDGRCDRCGSCRLVGYVCVPKKTEKKVKKVCWGVKCEPYCVPGRSIFCGWKCERDECGCWTYPVWQPTCAEVVERRIPEKREVTRVIPTWSWTAEERCAACACGLRSGAAGSGPAISGHSDPSCAAAP